MKILQHKINNIEPNYMNYNPIEQHLQKINTLFENGLNKMNIHKKTLTAMVRLAKDEKTHEEQSTTSSLIENIAIDVGTQLGFYISKKILKKILQLLATETMTTLLKMVSSTLLQKTLLLAATQCITKQIIQQSLIQLVKIGLAIVNTLDIIFLIFAVAGFIYDLIDVHGFRNMLGKKEIDAFKKAVDNEVLEQLKNYPKGEPFPIEVFPETYDIIDFKNDENLKIYMELLSEYIKAMEGQPNSKGEIISFKDPPNTIPLPMTAEEWHKELSMGWTEHMIPYAERFQKFTQRQRLFTIPVAFLCLLASFKFQ